MKDCEDGSMPIFTKVLFVLTVIIFFGGMYYVHNEDIRLRALKTSESQVKTEFADPCFGPALCDFEVTVPASYTHETYIDEFASRTRPLKTTYYFNSRLTSANFAGATNKLTPGKTYKVKIFPILGYLSSEDCLAFLKKQKAILVGAQGLTLVSDLKKDELPKGKWTASFDEKEALPLVVGYHRVPYINAYSDGGFDWNLDYFGSAWGGSGCLLCVCDLPTQAGL